MTRLIKWMICAAACLCVLTAVAEADVPINETTFPDDNFRAYVLENIDKDNDNVLSEGEIKATTYIGVSDKDIDDLTGIEHFIGLTRLVCDGNNLRSLDVSNCSKLSFLGCSDNKLANLNISGCTALDSLYCAENRLSALSVNHCTKLTTLSCSDNVLSELDVSKCNALTDLSCGLNKLSALDLHNCNELQRLECSFMQLTALDVTQCIALENLSCIGNPIGYLDVSHCNKLKELSCGLCGLESLDVSNCSQLSYLACENNNLTKLDVTGNKKLRDFSCGNNKLTSLNLSQATDLEYLAIAGNPIQVLDVSKSLDLEQLYCGSCNLTSLDLTNCQWIETLRSNVNTYPITVPSARTFNLNRLPGSFDVTRTSNWVGGTVSGNILTVSSGAKQVTYDYDAGNGYTANFTLNVTVDENMPAYRPGDADNNGTVNAADALAILHYCVDDDVTINATNADVNGDGQVSLHDALRIFQHEAGWDVELQ